MDYTKLSRSYDFRGIYWEEFKEEDFEILGRAFALWTESEKVAIGYDARLGSQSLAEAFIHGVLAMGKDVIMLNMVASDMLQFATLAWDDAEFGIMITASHSPKEYNGFKVYRKHAEPVNLKIVGAEIVHLIESGAIDVEVARDGTVEERDILDAWVEKIASFATDDLTDLTVVADAGNGVGGPVMTALSKKLGFKLVPLFFDADGNFPNHHPSPIESKNTLDMRKKVQELNADIGVAFDGDADRAMMCDEHGTMISSSMVMAAIAEMMLLQKPNGKVIYNTTTSDIVADTVRANGGTPIRERVGNVYIKEHMKRDREVVFAGESSSHYFFPELGNMDSGIIAFVYFLEYMAQFELKPSEVRKKFSKYQNIEETNFVVANAHDVMNDLAYAYNTGMQDRFDGLTVRFPDWWFNVRPAANDPVLRLNIEVSNSISLEEKFAELRERILRFAP